MDGSPTPAFPQIVKVLPLYKSLVVGLQGAFIGLRDTSTSPLASKISESQARRIFNQTEEIVQWLLSMI